jgi:YtkA-like protein
MEETLRTMIRKVLPVAVLAALAWAGGCKKGEAPQPSAQPVPAASAVTPLPAAPGTPWRMSLELDAPPRIVKATTFRLRLTDLSGKPVSGAKVEVSLVMKLMDMGKNEFALADRGSGNYEGSGTFSMAGVWNVVVTAGAGGNAGEQKFEVKVGN